MRQPDSAALQAYRQGLTRAGLGRYRDVLAALARYSIRLLPEVAVDDELPLGTSRTGGCPDLPAATRWPEYSEPPQSFVAQINLAETHDYDTDNLLPAAGLLSFCYDSAETGVWGFDPADAGGWAVGAVHPL